MRRNSRSSMEHTRFIPLSFKYPCLYRLRCYLLNMFWNPDHSDDDDVVQEFSFSGREGILLLIDSADYMFSEKPGRFNNFRESLEIVEAIIRNKVINSENDLIGIVFYNTKHSPLPIDENDVDTGLVVPKNTSLFMSLAFPSAESIKRIISLRESENLLGFEQKYGHAQGSNMSDVLWFCSRLLTRCGYKLEQSSIVLFTSNDEPHAAGSYEYQQTFIKAKDLQQLDVNVVLVPLSSDFNGDAFYQEFLCTVANECPDEFHFPCYQDSRERLMNRIFRRDFRKKTLSHIKFYLSETVQLGINIYSVSRKTRYPKKVTLLRDTNELLESKRFYQTISEDEERSVGCKSILPGHQRKSLNIGDVKVLFTVDEIVNIKQIFPPGLRLLGFKPLSKVSPLNHIRSSLFMYPDENNIDGSSVLFRALHEKCLKKQKAAYCMLTMRRKQQSKLRCYLLNMFWNPDHSDDDDVVQEFSFSGREGILLLIDSADYMFSEKPGRFNNFRESLEIVEAIIRNKVINSENDLIGIVFYNTKHSPLPIDENDVDTGLVVPKNTSLFMSLAFPSAESIKRIISLRESENLLGFEQKYGHAQGSNMSDVLWFCSRLLTRCGYKLEQSSIVLFTSNDEPHAAGSYEYQQTFIKAKDLQQLDVNVVLVPLSSDFNGDAFYQEFLCTVANECPDEFHFPCYQDSRERLMNRIFRRDFRKKTLSHIKFYLSETVQLGINIYSVSRKTRYPKKVTLLRDTNELLESKRFYQTISEDEERSVGCKSILPGHQRKSLNIGDVKVLFTVDEIVNIKQIFPPGLRLLGFKPLSKVSPLNHIRSSLFMYPDENNIDGSSVLFRALHEKCLKKQKAAYCMLTMRRKQQSKLIALIPQQHCVDDDGEPFRHSGFRIEFIPYATDIRKLEVFERHIPEVSEEQVDVFKAITKKIRFKFNPAQFENPVLSTIFTNIEALLFNRTDPIEYDSTKPDNDRIEAKIHCFVNTLRNIFGEDAVNIPKKRSKTTVEEGPNSKNPRTTLDLDYSAIEDAIRNGKTGTLLVTTLRAYLQQQGVEGVSKLNKAALIEKVKECHK
ncbi:X-ray repair cross-complementing protein 6 isoform X2 [Sabethes cyaneus]|uniref:X-ray repair cross-complementing protein 6 isoform X2 n=1 Tax=Sabethes cyaneus TaxID=53552 RepID=UPI00237DB07A|nr:X-ray repair cross-complementing protein 6 isoform X2 [Sabethes cyaneus]